jgi:prophage antirepressor-like protein
MSQITPFGFQGNPVRVITVDGEPWFFASDVCDRLEVRTRDAMSALKAYEKRRDNVAGTLIDLMSEAGVYSTIFRSRKPEAEEFRRWVTAEVLPQIRKTGSYAVRPLSPGEFLVQQAQMMLDQERRTAVLEAKVAAIEGAHDEFTTLAYAKLNDLPTDRPSCQRHGQRASRLMRSRGQQPRKRQDATFGTVNVYPVSVLEETAE